LTQRQGGIPEKKRQAKSSSERSLLHVAQFSQNFRVKEHFLECTVDEQRASGKATATRAEMRSILV